MTATTLTPHAASNTGRIAEDATRSLAERLPAWIWLPLGMIFVALSGGRYNVPLLGWFALTPFLVHLRLNSGAKACWKLFAALQLGVGLQIASIMTAPVPIFMAPMFSVPMALSTFLLLLLFEFLRRRHGDSVGVLVYVALSITAEWVAYTTSEAGVWGLTSQSQLENLPLLQLTAVTGVTGIAALLCTTTALLSVTLATPRPARLLPAWGAIAGVVLVVHLWGTLRLQTPIGGAQVRVAGVVSDIAPSDAAQLHTPAMQARVDDLFSRSQAAAERGAQLVIWNEGATAVDSTQEEVFVQRGQQLATRFGIDLVMAYVVPLDGMKHFENKYVWLGPEGTLETYFKHHPVPGEGAVVGTDPLVVHERPYGRAAGAICYDYDFPKLAHAQAEQGMDLAFVPSSDWRGIDPQHTHMARVRAIEGGFSLLRSVRWSTSAAFDGYGRQRASLSHFEDNDRILMAELPTTQVPTLYTAWGDFLPAGSLALLLAFLVWAETRRRV